MLVFECGELLPATWIVGSSTCSRSGSCCARSSRGASTLRSRGSRSASRRCSRRRSPRSSRSRRAGPPAGGGRGARRRRDPADRADHRAQLPARGRAGACLDERRAQPLHRQQRRLRDTFAMRPGHHWELLTTEPERHGITQPGASSGYFVRQAGAFALAHRSRSSRCSAASSTCSPTARRSRATPASTRPARARRCSPRSSHRGRSIFPMRVLVPVALLGIAALWRDRRRLAAPLGLLATIAAICVIFFVASRHRAPALPLFALFAAGGAAPVARMDSQRCRAGAAAAILLLVVLNIPTWETCAVVRRRGGLLPRPRCARRSRLRGRPRRVSPAPPRTIPRDARAWFELGNLLLGPRGRRRVGARRRARSVGHAGRPPGRAGARPGRRSRRPRPPCSSPRSPRTRATTRTTRPIT